VDTREVEAAAANSPPPLSPGEFARFARVITERLGIRMPDIKVTMLQGRLARRIRQLHLSSFEEYRKYLFSSPHSEREYVHFINAITTNKTDFFREPSHFEYLVERALPTLAAGISFTGSRRARIWCAGCSSGEEAWTLAMTLSEYAKKTPGFDFSILATDVSTRVLAHAQEATYPRQSVEPVPPALRQSYLLSSRDPSRKLVRMVPDLRRRVTFRRLNFMENQYGLSETYDVVFFRNVMIYFDKPVQEAVLNKLCRHLRHGGFLFVGHSESLAGLRVPLRQETLAVYRKTG